MTNDLVRRVYEHKEGFVSGYTKQHGVKTLVYFEIFDDPESAIHREKQLKAWTRVWKTEWIE